MRAVVYDPQARAARHHRLRIRRRRFVRKRLEPFTVRTPFGPDLAYLVELLAAGELDPQIGLRAPWDDVAEVAEALLDRRVAGKAVLDVA